MTIEYEPYDEEWDILEIRPHMLKGHYGQWFIFGHAEGKIPEFGYNLALARILDIKSTLISANYLVPPKEFYNDFLKIS